jgi:hypothetical protein
VIRLSCLYPGIYAVETSRRDRDLELRARRLARLHPRTQMRTTEEADALPGRQAARRRHIRDRFAR